MGFRVGDRHHRSQTRMERAHLQGARGRQQRAGAGVSRDAEAACVEINGGNVVYEILGDSGELIVLTPGGRLSKDIPGLRPLAAELGGGGFWVVLRDRT